MVGIKLCCTVVLFSEEVRGLVCLGGKKEKFEKVGIFFIRFFFVFYFLDLYILTIVNSSIYSFC